MVRSERKLRSVNSPFGLLIEQLYRPGLRAASVPLAGRRLGPGPENLTLEDCREYYRTHYAPNNAVVTIVGDIRTDEALKIVEKYYGPIPSQPQPRLTITPEKLQRGEKRASLQESLPGRRFFADFHIPAITHPDLIPLQILCARPLAVGRSSRFFEKFEKPGKAVEAQAEVGYPPFLSMDPGLLQIYAIASPSISRGYPGEGGLGRGGKPAAAAPPGGRDGAK